MHLSQEPSREHRRLHCNDLAGHESLPKSAGMKLLAFPKGSLHSPDLYEANESK